MTKYVAKRKDVCAGELLKPENVTIKAYYSFNNEVSKEELAKQGIGNINAYGGLVCRGMLFNVNENGLANDLIYTTPTNYPINGINLKLMLKVNL